MTENKWRENLKETTRLITSQAFSLKITNLILELQYGLMVINFDRAHVHTHTRTHILSKLVKNYCLAEVGLAPQSLIFGMVRNDACIGHLENNPFNFQLFDLQGVRLTVSEEEMPYSTLDLTGDKKIDGYNTLFSAWRYEL